VSPTSSQAAEQLQATSVKEFRLVEIVRLLLFLQVSLPCFGGAYISNENQSKHEALEILREHDVSLAPILRDMIDVAGRLVAKHCP